MEDAHIDRFFIDDVANGSIPCTSLAPPCREPLPLCLFLFGGGGSAENLTSLAPVLNDHWRRDALQAMRIVCAGVPPWCFYLDHEDSGMAYESLVGDVLPRVARERYATTGATGIVGISMGGRGALKIAFSRPHAYCAVAAVAPLMSPAFDERAVGARNRFFQSPEFPDTLFGVDRDPVLLRSEAPAWRARRYRDEIVDARLGIWLDAGDRDVLNAHDGVEFLHRVLWELDVSHEYHLIKDADHVGPSIVPRLLAAFAWVGKRAVASGNFDGDGEERALRDVLADAIAGAARVDASCARRLGRLRGYRPSGED